MNRLTLIAAILLGASLAAAYPAVAPGGALALGLLALAAVLGAAFTFAPLRGRAPLAWGLLFLFLAADGAALAVASTGAPLSAPGLASLAIPLLHALLVVAFVEAAHAANRSRATPGSAAVDLAAPFLRQAALALPALAVLLVAALLLRPLLASGVLPAAVGESYEASGPYGIALSALAVALAALALAGAARGITGYVEGARARRAAGPATPAEEETP